MTTLSKHKFFDNKETGIFFLIFSFIDTSQYFPADISVILQSLLLLVFDTFDIYLSKKYCMDKYVVVFIWHSHLLNNKAGSPRSDTYYGVSVNIKIKLKILWIARFHIHTRWHISKIREVYGTKTVDVNRSSWSCTMYFVLFNFFLILLFDIILTNVYLIKNTLVTIFFIFYNILQLQLFKSIIPWFLIEYVVLAYKC